MAIYYLDVNLILKKVPYGHFVQTNFHIATLQNVHVVCKSIHDIMTSLQRVAGFNPRFRICSTLGVIIIPCRWSSVQKTLNWKHQPSSTIINHHHPSSSSSSSSSSSFGSIIRHIPLYPHLSCLNPYTLFVFFLPPESGTSAKFLVLSWWRCSPWNTKRDMFHSYVV